MEKCLAVIASCKTLEQLEGAWNYIWLFFKMFHSGYDLVTIYHVKRTELEAIENARFN